MKTSRSGKNFMHLPLLALTLLTLFNIGVTPMVVAAPQSRTSICDTGTLTQLGDQQTNLSVNLAVNEIIGNTITAYATLTDSEGTAIVAAPVNFYVDNKDLTREWIGHAVTDCDGVAIIRFTREKAGPIDITAKFDGSNALKQNEVTASLDLKRTAQERPLTLSIESLGATMLVGIIVSGGVLGAVLAIREDKRDAILDK